MQPQELGTYGVMFALKGLYGLGRGVFEGSCRAVYASMFTGKYLLVYIYVSFIYITLFICRGKAFFIFILLHI